MKKIFQTVLLHVLVFMIVSSLFPINAFAETVEENYELRVLTFEDEGNTSYWTDLIPQNQYDDPLLYGGSSVESDAYGWCDAGNTELKHTLPFNYGTYNYWGGGHAISNYASTDFEAFGSYMYQLTVFQNDELEEGVMNRAGGGHNGSDNFAVHFGYKDDSGFNGIENLPALSFADGKARVIDHMYVNSTTYWFYSAAFGDGFARPMEETDWAKIIATGYHGENETGTAEFYLAQGYDFVCEWEPWDLSSLGAVTKVEFNFDSSVSNGYGNALPSYFAYDDVAVRFEKTKTDEIEISDIYVLPSETENTYDYYYYVGAPQNTSGKAIIALYAGNQFVGLDIFDIVAGDNDVFDSITTTKVPTHYKIMILDHLDHISPLCNAVTGNIN